MELPLWKKILCTKEGWEDWDFYTTHDKELYFYGMVCVAATFAFIAILGAFVTIVYYKPLMISVTILGLLGFCMVKMYLHIRKDSIEIKEMLLNGRT